MVTDDVLTQGRIVRVHRDVEFSSLTLSYNLLGALRGWGADMMCCFGVFFLPAGPGRVLYMSAQSHGLRDQCSSCSFSSGGNAAGREGWQFDGSVCWLLHGTFRAACPPSGEGWDLCPGVGRPLCQSALWLCEAQMVRQHGTPLGLDIISSSAKVASLTLTARNLSVLPWASCKTEEILLFSCVLSVTGNSPEGSLGLVAQTA